METALESKSREQGSNINIILPNEEAMNKAVAGLLSNGFSGKEIFLYRERDGKYLPNGNNFNLGLGILFGLFTGIIAAVFATTVFGWHLFFGQDPSMVLAHSGVPLAVIGGAIGMLFGGLSAQAWSEGETESVESPSGEDRIFLVVKGQNPAHCIRAAFLLRSFRKNQFLDVPVKKIA